MNCRTLKLVQPCGCLGMAVTDSVAGAVSSVAFMSIIVDTTIAYATMPTNKKPVGVLEEDADRLVRQNRIAMSCTTGPAAPPICDSATLPDVLP